MAFGRTPGLAKTAAQANYKHLLLGLVIAILQWNKPALDRSRDFPRHDEKSSLWAVGGLSAGRCHGFS
jgi:hypothetical protein